MFSNRMLACAALASLLAACSPAAQTDADEKSFRAETPAQAEVAAEKPMPVLDAQGNELDPELADAVRAKMAEEQAARQSGDDPDPSADEGGARADNAT